MTREEIKNKVVAIVADKIGFSVNEIEESTRFKVDLGTDSLDDIELLMEFERVFGIKIPDEEMFNIVTVGDVINGLAARFGVVAEAKENPKESEDERKIDDIIRIICVARECSKIANIGEEKEFDSSFYDELVLFLKEHFRLQTKQEWSEEDERIRRIMIDHFKNQPEQYTFGGLTNDEVVAYLERQKPMETLEIPAGDVVPAEEDAPFDEDEFLENELSAFLQNYDKEYDDDAAVSDVAKHFYEVGKKQKEQKPIELPKSEDYGIDGLYAAVDILQKTLGEVDGYQTDDGILEHKCAISAVKELYEQKPAEWSEEDERLLTKLMTFVDIECFDRECNGQEVIDWLKSFRPQPHWKPSEEQMDILDKVYHYLWADKNATADMQDGLGDFIDELKFHYSL